MDGGRFDVHPAGTFSCVAHVVKFVCADCITAPWGPEYDRFFCILGTFSVPHKRMTLAKQIDCVAPQRHGNKGHSRFFLPKCLTALRKYNERRKPLWDTKEAGEWAIKGEVLAMRKNGWEPISDGAGNASEESSTQDPWLERRWAEFLLKLPAMTLSYSLIPVIWAVKNGLHTGETVLGEVMLPLSWEYPHFAQRETSTTINWM